MFHFGVSQKPILLPEYFYFSTITALVIVPPGRVQLFFQNYLKVKMVLFSCTSQIKSLVYCEKTVVYKVLFPYVS
jgi:hypothetical protein